MTPDQNHIIAMRSCATRQCGCIVSRLDLRGKTEGAKADMALEIKILDYGDIELESSFLVLGRDCGRTRRVLTPGLLIYPRGPPPAVDPRHPSHTHIETLRHSRPPLSYDTIPNTP